MAVSRSLCVMRLQAAVARGTRTTRSSRRSIRAGGLSELGGAGGGVTRIAAVDTQAGEISVRFPYFLPGGKALLFLATHVPAEYEGGSIGVVSLADQKRKIVLPDVGMYPRYVSCYLTYVSKGMLFAVPF